MDRRNDMPEEAASSGTVRQGAGAYSIGSAIWPGLSKLIEEAGEVMQVAGKIIGTGGDTDHWDGTDLLSRLEDEVADLLAAIKFVMDKNALNQRAMRKRSEAKQALFNEWHSQSDGHSVLQRRNCEGK